MSWKWSFWKAESTATGRGAEAGGREVEPRGQEEWEARLLAAGVPEAWIPQIAERLAPSYADLGKGSATALVEGVALAVEVQAEVQADVERNMKDVREVERLLGAFSGELEKLDEVLEVLAAYAQRMRAKPAKATRRVLH